MLNYQELIKRMKDKCSTLMKEEDCKKCVCGIGPFCLLQQLERFTMEVQDNAE